MEGAYVQKGELTVAAIKSGWRSRQGVIMDLDNLFNVEIGHACLIRVMTPCIPSAFESTA
ncbi:MAG: hypothetical protein ABSE07_03480 [Methanoregula sp.]